MVGFNRRFDPSFKALRDRVQAGEIGRLEQVIITSRDPAPAPVEYLKVSGGIFRDMTIHDFDMARYLAGDIVEVQVMGANLIEPAIKEIGDVDAAMVTLRAKSGALVHINNSRRCAYGYDQRVEAFGEKGMLQALNRHPTTVVASGAERTEAATPCSTSSSSATARPTTPKSITSSTASRRAPGRSPASPRVARPCAGRRRAGEPALGPDRAPV